jgi:hypothetical protein
MDDRVKLPMSFDVRRMQQDVARFRTSDWIAHFVGQNYEGDWSVLPLRGPLGAVHPIQMIYSDPVCTEFADTPFLQRSRYFPEVLEWFRCPVQAVRLMRLSAGSRIKEHTDLDLDAELGTARLHIPIRTTDEVEFRLNGTRVVLREGECWYLRLSDPHSVENRGTTDRIHLVIDARVNPWLRERLET